MSLSRDELATLNPMEKYFYVQSQAGLVPTVKEMIEYGERNNIPYQEEDLPDIKFRFNATGVHARVFHAKNYAILSYARYGLYYVDYAEFMLKQRNLNKGFQGFIIFVEAFSEKMFAFPVKNKSIQSWENSVRELIETRDGDARSFYSDRDSAVTEKFVERLRNDFGVGWNFAFQRHKASKAEIAIRYLKTDLTVACKMSKSFKWVDKLPGIIKKHNSELVEGTEFAREDVNKYNFSSFLSELTNLASPTLKINIADTFNLDERLADKLFKHAVGSQVRISQTLLKNVKGSIFRKASVQGRYSSESFEVVSRKLKSDSKGRVIPTYKLKNSQGTLLPGVFYSSDLVPDYSDLIKKRKLDDS